jgi:hypothetical protein
LRRFLSISRSRTGRRKKIARKISDSTDMSVLAAAWPCVRHRFGGAPSSPSSAMDSLIAESAWMFFIR